MTRIEQIREQALTLTRAQATDTLVESFEKTDAIIDEIRAANDWTREDEYLAIVESRGWIMDVLIERGEEARIGL